jgi:hypothetical protein
MQIGTRTVNPAIAILIGFSDHLINFIICQLLSNGCHDVAEFGSGDETVVVTIEYLWRNISIYTSRLCIWM